MDLVVTLAALAFLVVVLLAILYLSVRVVQQYERMVVFRLGKTNEGMVRGPGLLFLIPFVDRPVKVDLREQFIEVPSQTTITKDNAPDQHRLPDLLAHQRPAASVVNVANFAGALQGIATTTLRAVIGDILLDDVLSKREQINEVLRTKLDESDRALGRQGHHRRDPRDHPAARRPGRHEPDALRRAQPARRHHRVRGHPPVDHQRRRGREAVGDPARGGQAPVGHPRAPRASARPWSGSTGRPATIDEKTMTLQYLEALKAIGAEPVDQVRHPDGVHPARRAGRGLRVRRALGRIGR